jgi:death-on-curing protein
LVDIKSFEKAGGVVLEPVWIREIEALALHGRLFAQFGVSDGLRDADLLDSALARPKNRFAYAGSPPTLAESADAYAFGICKNYPFVDGNTRTAMAVSFLFSEFNGAEITASQEDSY